MNRIIIKIKNDSLFFNEKSKLSLEKKSLINTTIINKNELIFSNEYIKLNQNIVTDFIKELCKNHNIHTIIFEKNELCKSILSIFHNNKFITNLILKEDKLISYQLCELIINTNIKHVNCYNIQPFMIELLNNHDITVESRNEILFISTFMKKNNLNTLSSLYYKEKIILDLPLESQDEEDFLNFCNINNKLKTIYLTNSNLKDLEYITNTLKSTSHKNISIIIQENITNIKKIEYLKEYNKKKKKNKIQFVLKYSDDYIKTNFLKQTNNRILNTCGLIIILIVTISFGYVFYDNYKSMNKDTTIKKSVNDIIQNTNVTDIIKDLENDNVQDDVQDDVQNNVQNNNTNKGNVINNDIAALLTVNPDTIGWLKVNNTNINYPVVQAINNDYYLKHNFNLEEDNNGWVFLNYKNSYKELDDNTIFFAHNRYHSGIMFGTLQNTLKSNWYKNPDNLIINFKTLYKNYEFKIFSIYKIKLTSDYLSTDFVNNDAKLKFLNKLKQRSIYNFNYNPNPEDKIITLSTCANEQSRIVLHAYLIKK